ACLPNSPRRQRSSVPSSAPSCPSSVPAPALRRRGPGSLRRARPLKAAGPTCPRRCGVCGLSPSCRRRSREAPLFRGLDALAVDDGHGGRRLFARGFAGLIAQAVVYPLEGAVVAPLGEIVVDAVPLGIVLGQHAPL